MQELGRNACFIIVRTAVSGAHGDVLLHHTLRVELAKQILWPTFAHTTRAPWPALQIQRSKEYVVHSHVSVAVAHNLRFMLRLVLSCLP